MLCTTCFTETLLCNGTKRQCHAIKQATILNEWFPKQTQPKQNTNFPRNVTVRRFTNFIVRIIKSRWNSFEVSRSPSLRSQGSIISTGQTITVDDFHGGRLVGWLAFTCWMLALVKRNRRDHGEKYTHLAGRFDVESRASCRRAESSQLLNTMLQRER